MCYFFNQGISSEVVISLVVISFQLNFNGNKSFIISWIMQTQQNIC